MPTDFKGFKQGGNTIPVNDTTARNGVIANTQLIKDTVGWSGKNKLRNDIVSQTLHTTVISVNADKSVSFTNAPNNELWLTVNGDIRLSAGRYKLSGCPANGGSTKYFLRFVVRNADDTANEETYFDYGTGTEFEITSTTAGRKCTCSIYIKSGQATGFTFYPMIRDADILDPTYEPYFGSTAFPRSEQAVLGAKNLALANRATTQTISSMDFSVDSSDVNVVTANGTNSAEVWFNYMDIELPEGNYIGSGCTNGSDTTHMLSFIIRNAGNTGDETTIKCFNGDVNITVPTGGRHVRAFIVVRNGKTLTNQMFKLMIRLATDTDDTYVPYAMTNEQLTIVNGREEVVLNLTGISDTNGLIEAVFTNTIPLMTQDYQKCAGVIRVAGVDAFGFIVYRISSTQHKALLFKERFIYTSVNSNGTITSYKHEGTLVS